MHSCFDCIHCIDEDFLIYCSKTEKLIDDGFGYGDCSTCSYFRLKATLIFTIKELDKLPF